MDIQAEMTQLKELLEMGVLTQEEFDVERKALAEKALGRSVTVVTPEQTSIAVAPKQCPGYEEYQSLERDDYDAQQEWLEANITTHFEAWKRAADNKVVAASFLLGISYLYQEKQDQALSCLRWAAEQGHAEAQCELAGLFMDMDEDAEEVLRWTHKAANQQDASGQYRLHVLYWDGTYTEKDRGLATQWLLKAAAQGHVEAESTLALRLQYNSLVVDDWAEVARCLRLGAEKGTSELQEALGNLLFEGRPPAVLQDLTEAVRWSHAAAKQGQILSAARLGHMYREGNGVGKNIEEAIHWYRKGEWFHYIGDIYRLGDGVAKDETQAIQWYQQAADAADETLEPCAECGMLFLPEHTEICLGCGHEIDDESLEFDD